MYNSFNMALSALHKSIKFSVGDTIQVVQKIKEGDKERLQTFEGIVIGIKGRNQGQTFTVRRIGAQNIGIERIFPVNAPAIEEIKLVKQGKRGVRRAKIYFIRNKSPREVERIYSRAGRREKAKKK
ncbi:MAG: 50S ribosomal protein L19 [Candidatus Woesebacteria bacterium GW2011_GWC1_43_10b]|uniref:50S ribosomal protein L19 n=2 Tax=Candidatus Woeseibacteriota TaxID=1752722 RepID=A0A0G1FSN5_9BACT|nr:MAG: 50S ribosomal protein L19 [Candidatus Woesebacteria bacterium GW2011_GWC1_43_10b]KKS98036.1 MAG: 50S ribosomal protein L19 [Candidatus Woesebacteria bacterium GW2011_GWB1_43_14]